MWMVNKMLTKMCTKCKTEYPASSEFFSKDNRTKSGFQFYCKTCQKQYYRANVEKTAEREKKYRKANKEKISARKKEYYKANTEKISKSHKKYNENNVEKIAACQKEYYKANVDRFAERHKEYEKDHYVERRLNNHRRKAKRKSLISDFTTEQWEFCLAYFNYKDAYTGLPMDVP